MSILESVDCGAWCWCWMLQLLIRFRLKPEDTEQGRLSSSSLKRLRHLNISRLLLFPVFHFFVCLFFLVTCCLNRMTTQRLMTIIITFLVLLCWFCLFKVKQKGTEETDSFPNTATTLHNTINSTIQC